MLSFARQQHQQQLARRRMSRYDDTNHQNHDNHNDENAATIRKLHERLEQQQENHLNEINQWKQKLQKSQDTQNIGYWEKLTDVLETSHESREENIDKLNYALKCVRLEKDEEISKLLEEIEYMKKQQND